MNYQLNPNPEYLDSVIGLALGSDGVSIHQIENPDIADGSFQIAMNRTRDWLVSTYGGDELVERKILIAL